MTFNEIVRVLANVPELRALAERDGAPFQGTTPEQMVQAAMQARAELAASDPEEATLMVTTVEACVAALLKESLKACPLCGDACVSIVAAPPASGGESDPSRAE